MRELMPRQLDTLIRYRFHLVLSVLVALILTPLLSTISGLSPGIIVLIIYTLIISVSLIMADRRIPKVLIIIFGAATLLAVWCEFFSGKESFITVIRMISSLLLFSLLAYVLIRHFLDESNISLAGILGAMSGYILIGLIGGVLFELIEYYNPGSVLKSTTFDNYDFYYFGFISLVTVGYGDIVPLKGMTKSLAVLISLIGQFYLTIGIALFVGKYYHQMSKNK